MYIYHIHLLYMYIHVHVHCTMYNTFTSLSAAVVSMDLRYMYMIARTCTCTCIVQCIKLYFFLSCSCVHGLEVGFKDGGRELSCKLSSVATAHTQSIYSTQFIAHPLSSIVTHMYCIYIHVHVHALVHVYKHITYVHVLCMYMINNETTKQRNTTTPETTIFFRKMSCSGGI